MVVTAWVILATLLVVADMQVGTSVGSALARVVSPANFFASLLFDERCIGCAGSLHAFGSLTLVLAIQR